MTPDPIHFEVRLARSDADLRAAGRLRYRVFVEELGGDGPLVDHDLGIERDEFDAVADHLLLIDSRHEAGSDSHVVGVYRLLSGDRAATFGRFYCDSEYDLTPLRQSGRQLLELGRSCVDPAYRGGTGMFLMWNALAHYVLERGIEVLFGVASFRGIDPEPLAAPLSWLHHHHLAPPELRPVAHPEGFQAMDLLPEAELDRTAAMAAMPALIKAYLRLGGKVGHGAWIDRAFNTTDVLLLVDTAAMSARYRAYYTGRRAAP